MIELTQEWIQDKLLTTKTKINVPKRDYNLSYAAKCEGHTVRGFGMTLPKSPIWINIFSYNEIQNTKNLKWNVKKTPKFPNKCAKMKKFGFGVK